MQRSRQRGRTGRTGYGAEETWREQDVDYERERFGSPHDQGYPSAPRRYSRVAEHQRGYQSVSGEGWGEYRPIHSWAQEYGARRQAREEEFRDPREEVGSSWREDDPRERRASGFEHGRRPERFEAPSYQEEPFYSGDDYQPRRRSEPGRGSVPPREREAHEQGWREPMYYQEQRGLEEYYGGQQHFSPAAPPGYQREPRAYGPEPEHEYEPQTGEGWMAERRGWEETPPTGQHAQSYRGGEHAEYEQWLREHEGRDWETEPERRLEGLREDDRGFDPARDDRSERECIRQSRSQRRRFEEATRASARSRTPKGRGR